MSELANPHSHDRTYTFGNSQSFEITRLSVDGNNVEGHNRTTEDTLTLGRASIYFADYLEALDDINESWRVIEDKKTGKQFEIAVTNLKANAEEGVDAEMSTYTSSISGNVGNATEFAEHSALRPDHRRLYIASFGNGRFSYWDADEQAYIKQTGRFTQASGRALPTVSALQRALEAQDLKITRVLYEFSWRSLCYGLDGRTPGRTS